MIEGLSFIAMVVLVVGCNPVSGQTQNEGCYSILEKIINLAVSWTTSESVSAQTQIIEGSGTDGQWF